MLCSGLPSSAAVLAVVANCIDTSIQSYWALPLRQSASTSAVDCACQACVTAMCDAATIPHVHFVKLCTAR